MNTSSSISSLSSLSPPATNPTNNGNIPSASTATFSYGSMSSSTSLPSIIPSGTRDRSISWEPTRSSPAATTTNHSSFNNIIGLSLGSVSVPDLWAKTGLASPPSEDAMELDDAAYADELVFGWKERVTGTVSERGRIMTGVFEGVSGIARQRTTLRVPTTDDTSTWVPYALSPSASPPQQPNQVTSDVAMGDAVGANLGAADNASEDYEDMEIDSEEEGEGRGITVNRINGTTTTSSGTHDSVLGVVPVTSQHTKVAATTLGQTTTGSAEGEASVSQPMDIDGGVGPKDKGKKRTAEDFEKEEDESVDESGDVGMGSGVGGAAESGTRKKARFNGSAPVTAGEGKGVLAPLKPLTAPPQLAIPPSAPTAPGIKGPLKGKGLLANRNALKAPSSRVPALKPTASNTRPAKPATRPPNTLIPPASGVIRASRVTFLSPAHFPPGHTTWKMQGEGEHAGQVCEISVMLPGRFIRATTSPNWLIGTCAINQIALVHKLSAAEQVAQWSTRRDPISGRYSARVTGAMGNRLGRSEDCESMPEAMELAAIHYLGIGWCEGGIEQMTPIDIPRPSRLVLPNPDEKDTDKHVLKILPSICKNAIASRSNFYTVYRANMKGGKELASKLLYTKAPFPVVGVEGEAIPVVGLPKINVPNIPKKLQRRPEGEVRLTKIGGVVLSKKEVVALEKGMTTLHKGVAKPTGGFPFLLANNQLNPMNPKAICVAKGDQTTLVLHSISAIIQRLAGHEFASNDLGGTITARQGQLLCVDIEESEQPLYTTRGQVQIEGDDLFELFISLVLVPFAFKTRRTGDLAGWMKRMTQNTAMRDVMCESGLLARMFRFGRTGAWDEWVDVPWHEGGDRFEGLLSMVFRGTNRDTERTIIIFRDLFPWAFPPALPGTPIDWAAVELNHLCQQPLPPWITPAHIQHLFPTYTFRSPNVLLLALGEIAGTKDIMRIMNQGGDHALSSIFTTMIIDDRSPDAWVGESKGAVTETRKSWWKASMWGDFLLASGRYVGANSPTVLDPAEHYRVFCRLAYVAVWDARGDFFGALQAVVVEYLNHVGFWREAGLRRMAAGVGRKPTWK